MAAARVVYTTTFVLYCRASEGDWARQGEWAETDEFEALTAAHDADDQAQWQAVRLMSRRTYPDGRPPQETIAWMTGIPRAGKTKPRGSGGGGSDRGGGDSGGGESGRENGGRATTGADGNNAPPGKKRRKKRKGGAESAGEAYKKIAKQHLEATGAIGGAHSVKKAAEEAALREAEAGKPPKSPMIAVGTRLVTVFIITAVITFAGKIPLEILQKKLAATGYDIPGFMIAGYVLGFATAALILGKILLKEGDMEILTQYFQDARTGGQDDDEFDAYDSGLGSWREDTIGDDPMAVLEEEAVVDSSAATMASGLDYPPENVPAEPRKTMLKFLELALGAIRSQLAKLDKLGKFGLNLYLAGAGDQLAKYSGLEGAQRNGMISEAIVAIGTKKAMAGPFCDKFAEYEKDSKSRAMIDAGRSAMQRFIDGDIKAFGELPAVLEGFTSNKAAKATAQGVVVVMFTDLVGSTKMTQELGDIGAQQVVRTHNAIVRNALAAYHGREVKHTGDGIMAVFSNAANAVASTMVIQQELSKHNGTQGSLPVKVRIGLNAGAAVQEEDDFFGTTVQLSARVCDKADADQIFITQSVRDLVTGHSIQFREAGNFDMKGIEKPVPVYEVVWRAQLQAAG
ncbi:adenylate/guanylate cyclase domain-containing protein [Thalassospiraceae bacterium LMO-SO8]|nr:adenylate/guanylate cyclase domain-containing protein [Alphaproteobacteria bacterium LMO-S08]WND76898.1 adenylate/guanylate cyclase domain-containing protein [Thalassospiraceae bacterium LMO-SO8]